MAVLRLLIVDDHQIVRQGLRAILRVLPDIELVGEADGGLSAVIGSGLVVSGAVFTALAAGQFREFL